MTNHLTEDPILAACRAATSPIPPGGEITTRLSVIDDEEAENEEEEEEVVEVVLKALEIGVFARGSEGTNACVQTSGNNTHDIMNLKQSITIVSIRSS
mmetsp:Transcript_1502/g.2738  ORF Transcript_1502/g.2738 Transcript_1502/m.2738 type:complete len:98 (-) Transcript_1502:147-440(-)